MIQSNHMAIQYNALHGKYIIRKSHDNIIIHTVFKNHSVGSSHDVVNIT